MFYAGIDLHKQSITVCVVNEARKIEKRKRLMCANEAAIVAFFKEVIQELGPFRAVVEATASYEWLIKLIEPLADKVILAHPGKLRVIAESTRKSDRLDAQVLAEFLSRDMVPASYRPTPRQRDHRGLVRQRSSIQRRITSVKNRMRRIMSNYNADRPDLFRKAGQEYVSSYPLSAADRICMNQLTSEWLFFLQQLKSANQALVDFAGTAPIREQHQRELLQSIPGVGFVITEVVLSEIADIDRFDSQKPVVAYAGLAPGQRESAGKMKELHIEKAGSRYLRWALVEAAWQLVYRVPRWKTIYERLKKRLKAKKAIVAIARRLLGMMVAIMKSGEPFTATHQPA